MHGFQEPLFTRVAPFPPGEHHRSHLSTSGVQFWLEELNLLWDYSCRQYDPFTPILSKECSPLGEHLRRKYLQRFDSHPNLCNRVCFATCYDSSSCPTYKSNTEARGSVESFMVYLEWVRPYTIWPDLTKSQVVLFTSSLKATLFTTIFECQACKTSLVSYGKSMRWAIRGIWPRIHWYWYAYFEFFHNLNVSGVVARSKFLPIQTLNHSLPSNTDYEIVQCMESWTVVRNFTPSLFPTLLMHIQVTWGPLCLLTAVLITKDSPYRHPIQALASTGHVYGNLIYYSTCLYEDYVLGKRYYRPEPCYFWLYFTLMNLPWLIVRKSCFHINLLLFLIRTESLGVD